MPVRWFSSAVILCINLAACATDSGSSEPVLSAGNSRVLVSDARALVSDESGRRGKVRVVDGDTLILDGKTHRLFGIDSPEASQQCQRKDLSRWPCGRYATEFLTRLILDQRLDCQEVPGTRDRYGRQISLCTADGLDVNRQMVASGNAWAYRRYSSRYIGAERQAKAQGRGVWQGVSEPPWHVRKELARKRSVEQILKQADLPAAGSGCLIKGNISAGGKIFHLPGSRDYDRTVIKASRGERWFCTVAEAKSAGWRARR